MTNPNDILDAYDEIVRLTDILGTDTIQQLVNRAAQRTAVLAETVNEDTEQRWTVIYTATPGTHTPTTQPTTHPTGCPWCGLDIGKNTMLRHLNNIHRDDLEQLYVDDGIKGLQDTFGVPYGTAWNWARKIDGEAA